MHGSCFIHVFKIKLSSFIIFVRWRRRKWHCHRTQFQAFLPLKTSRQTIKYVPVRSTKTKITSTCYQFYGRNYSVLSTQKAESNKNEGTGCPQEGVKKVKVIVQLVAPSLTNASRAYQMQGGFNYAVTTVILSALPGQPDRKHTQMS